MLRFKTGERVSDIDSNTPATLNVPDDLRGPFIAIRHRAFSSSSVYFGPFATLEELTAWCDKHNMSVSIVSLTDPSSSQETWWNK